MRLSHGVVFCGLMLAGCESINVFSRVQVPFVPGGEKEGSATQAASLLNVQGFSKSLLVQEVLPTGNTVVDFNAVPMTVDLEWEDYHPNSSTPTNFWAPGSNSEFFYADANRPGTINGDFRFYFDTSNYANPNEKFDFVLVYSISGGSEQTVEAFTVDGNQNSYLKHIKMRDIFLDDGQNIKFRLKLASTQGGPTVDSNASPKLLDADANNGSLKTRLGIGLTTYGDTF